jgi:hypothetical protein
MPGKQDEAPPHAPGVSFHDMWASAKGKLQHLRDETAETFVYGLLKQAVGAYFPMSRHTVDFQLSEGIIDFKQLNFLPAARDMVTQQLHDAGLPLKLVLLQIGGIHIENFFTSDLLDGDIDHCLSITLKDVVVVLEPDRIINEAEKSPKQLAKEKKERVKEAKKLLKAEKAKDKARKKALKKGEKFEEDETSTLVRTFLQTLELGEVTRLHVRLQDPHADPPVNMTFVLGDEDMCGKIRSCSHLSSSFL